MNGLFGKIMKALTFLTVQNIANFALFMFIALYVQ